MGSNIINNTNVAKPATESTATTSTKANSDTTVAPTPVVKTVSKPVITQKSDENNNVNKLKKLLDSYELAVTTDSMQKDSFTSIKVFINICEYLNQINDPSVFEYFFKYFQKHQNDNMYYEKALRGIHLIQNKLVKTRVSATHACYLELCRVRSLKKATYHFTANAMQVMNISSIQSKWLINKSLTRN